MKVGDKVFHVDYPTICGVIVARYKGWAQTLPVFLVKWENTARTSQHIEGALRRAA